MQGSCAEADPFAPGLDFGGQPAFRVRLEAPLRDLLGQSLDEELRAARVVQQWQTEVDGVPTRRMTKTISA